MMRELRVEVAVAANSPLSRHGWNTSDYHRLGFYLKMHVPGRHLMHLLKFLF